MSRDLYYYTDLRTKKRHRMRVICMPTGSDLLRPDEVPEWDATPSGTSNFFRLRAGAISLPTPKEPQAKFEKYVIGMATTPVYSLTVNFALLYTDADGAASATAQAFAGYVRNYVSTYGWSYEYAVPDVGSAFRDFDTSNVWWILTDDGDRTKTISQFRTIFCGVQRVLPQKEGKITTGYTVTQDIELFHIGRAMLDTVRMDDVCTHLVNTYSYHGGGGYNIFFDTVFAYSGSNFGWGYYLNPVATDGARFYQFEDIFFSLETLMSRALFAWLRRNPYDAGDMAEVSALLVSASNSTGGSPWDHWDLYEQAGTQTTNRGTALDREDWYVLGEIMVGANSIGGLFFPSDDDTSLARDGYSAWDFLSESATAAICKVSFVQQDQWSLYLRMLRPKESIDIVTLTRASLRHSDPKKPAEWKFTESYEVIANATVSIDGGYGDDCQPPVEVKNFGSRNEQGGTATTVFDVCPSIGEADQWKQRHPTALISGIEFEGLALAEFNIPLRKIWYIGDAGMLPDPTPIRCHHAPLFQYHGTESYDVTSPINLPEDTSIDDNDDFEAWRDAMRVSLAQLYRTDGQTAMMAHVMIALFGSEKITKYDLKVPANLATVNNVGDEYRIGPAGGTGYTAQPLVNSPHVDITDLPGVCYLLSVKIDDDLYLADIEIVGVST